MPWVLKAAENLGVDNDDGGGNTDTALQAAPSWVTAAALCPHTMLTEPMQRVLTFNSRMRDSVAITVSKAVTSWVRLGLGATDHLDGLSTIEQLSIGSFDLSMLDERDATLFFLARAMRGRSDPLRISPPSRSNSTKNSLAQTIYSTEGDSPSLMVGH